ncbi:TraB/GumN family protein [Frigidibacter sp. RF13]|uniref:TraB/GumN family protein n=1 Tax=Frigidibacter sp. RF13 TaxID=2997340 RepID=UPI0022701AF0|nr:TraB/GumN family protein [Frigidibacter sp. RF13]MCY1127144.1 TraB/GumN family protein [Frigidibacter sp. RF13]
MFRSALAALALLLAPTATTALTCAGEDMIAALPPADRAELDAATEAAPYPSGNHWRAVKDGSVIDIVGTMHIYDPRMDAPAERLLPVIRAADAIYLEATDKEMEAIQSAIATRPDLMVSTGPTLPERLSEPEWQALSAAMTERGVPPFIAAKMQPWYVSVLLSMPPCAMGAMATGADGLDHLIGEAAKAEGKPLHALEPYDTIFRIFGTISAEEQIDMLRTALPTVSQSEDMLRTMMESYFREDHRQIMDFARLAAIRALPDQAETLNRDFAEMEEALVYGRNRAWVEILRDAAPGKTLLVAVGAGHLSGEDGLLSLLEREGYSLERRPF